MKLMSLLTILLLLPIFVYAGGTKVVPLELHITGIDTR